MPLIQVYTNDPACKTAVAGAIYQELQGEGIAKSHTVTIFQFVESGDMFIGDESLDSTIGRDTPWMVVKVGLSATRSDEVRQRLVDALVDSFGGDPRRVTTDFVDRAGEDVWIGKVQMRKRGNKSTIEGNKVEEVIRQFLATEFTPAFHEAGFDTRLAELIPGFGEMDSLARTELAVKIEDGLGWSGVFDVGNEVLNNVLLDDDATVEELVSGLKAAFGQ